MSLCKTKYTQLHNTNAPGKNGSGLHIRVDSKGNITHHCVVTLRQVIVLAVLRKERQEGSVKQRLT